MIKRIISLTLATMVVVSTFITTTLFATSDLDTPFRPSDIPTGLVGYWKFNNDATDSSGSGYNLTPVNTPTYVASGNYWKDAYTADLESGSTQKYTITHANGPNLNITGDYTVAYWMKAESWPGVSYVFNTGMNGSSTGFAIGHHDGSIIRVLHDGDAQGISYSFSTGRMYHVAVVHDDSEGKAYGYVDGNYIGTASIGNITSNASSDKVVGAYGQSGAEYCFDGLLNDVGVWNVALTPLQVKSLALGVDLSKYAYRPNNVSTQPTHWWKLNEVSGNRADSVATNPLTLTDNSAVPSAGGYIEGIAAKLNGANADYFSYAAGDDSFVVGTGDFSISLWYNNLGTDAIPRLFDIGGYVANQPHNFSVLGPNSSTGSFKLYTGGGGSATELKDWTCIPVDSDTWTHYVLRRASGTISLFQDGVKVGTDVTGNATDVTYNEFYLGAWQGIPTAYAPVKIADCGFWKGYALSDAEIKSLACALPIQRQGIVSYWKMDEESGNRADAIGSNTLTDNNSVLYGTGKVGNAADFEASQSEYLSIANASQTGLGLTEDFTLLAWLNWESTGTQHIFDKRNSAGTTGYYLRIESSKVTVGSDAVTQSGATSISTGTYAHCVGLLDGANRTVYLNGVMDGTNTTTDLPTNNAEDFVIGRRNALTDSYLDGLLDEAIVAKRYFRPEEIKAVYLKGLNSKEATSTELSPSASIRRILTVS